MASTMQLEFTQAMSDFKTMFPDMDREVIEAVLRANQGAVDATIDQLLAMSTDNQNEKLRNELEANMSPQRSLINLSDTETDASRGGSARPQPPVGQLIDTTDGNTVTNSPAAAAANAALLNLSSSGACSPLHLNTGASPKQRPAIALPGSKLQAALPATGYTSTPTKRALSSRRWNPPMLGALPSGFLRIAPTAAEGTRDFELPDEQFAMMLQNEEFMNQLRWNQEFMNALEKEQSSGKAKGEDDAAFKERLKHMGKVSRKKFLQMARVFTWQRNKKVTTAKQIDSLPLKEEHSDDEDPHHHHQHQQSQQQQQLRK